MIKKSGLERTHALIYCWSIVVSVADPLRNVS